MNLYILKTETLMYATIANSREEAKSLFVVESEHEKSHPKIIDISEIQEIEYGEVYSFGVKNNE